MFDFTLLDILNRPEIRALRAGTKLAAKGISSAVAKSNSKTLETSELTELMNAARAGDSNAQLELSLYYAENRKFETATHWLMKSVEQGNERAIEVFELLQGG